MSADIISIIIALYNQEKYIEHCIQSVINQDDKDIEIIVVNDGSKDNSVSLCKKYVKEYKYIRIIECSNNGVSTARNIGISKASGYWIMFLDADDMLQPNCLKTIRKSLSKNIEIIYANYDTIINKKVAYTPIDIKKFKSDIILKKTLSHVSYPSILPCVHKYSSLLQASWGKLFRRDIIEKYELKFNPSLKLSEDTMFNISYLEHIKNVEFMDIPVYYYRTNEDSVTKTFKKNYIKSQENLSDLLVEKFGKNQEYKEFAYKYILNNFIRLGISVERLGDKSDRADFINAIKEHDVYKIARIIKGEDLSTGNVQNIFYKLCVVMWSYKMYNLPFGVMSLYNRLKRRKA